MPVDYGDRDHYYPSSPLLSYSDRLSQLSQPAFNSDDFTDYPSSDFGDDLIPTDDDDFLIIGHASDHEQPEKSSWWEDTNPNSDTIDLDDLSSFPDDSETTKAAPALNVRSKECDLCGKVVQVTEKSDHAFRVHRDSKVCRSQVGKARRIEQQAEQRYEMAARFPAISNPLGFREKLPCY
jgi:hypothetical protein